MFDDAKSYQVMYLKNRILDIEDNFNNMLLIKRIVEAEGHEFLTFFDGEGGWIIAAEEHPDMIFVDLRLPGEVDGFELLRRIKSDSDLRHMPVVVLTAGGSIDADKQARAYGWNGFCKKPAGIQDIRELIQRHVDQEETVERLRQNLDG